MAKKNNEDPKNRWRFVRNLTESGQGWLYIVEDNTGQLSGQHVRKVLKTLDRLPRFQREVEVTNALAHAGARVLPIVDAYLEPQAGERAYYVAPYYPSGDFRRKLNTRVFVGDLDGTLTMIEELYGLLRDIHLNTAHRDLKPENILLNDQGQMVLCDFGICVPLMEDTASERISETLEQMGSRHYIAPEALAGYKAVGNPIPLDVYAFGKIAYEAAAGFQLLGLQLPDGDNNLARLYGKETAWSILNSLISSLVSHDTSVRMSAWERFQQMVATIRKAREEVAGAIDPDMAEALFRKRFEESNEVQAAKLLSERNRNGFLGNVSSAIVDAFNQDKVVQRLKSLALSLNNVFNVGSGNRLDASWFEESGVDAQAPPPTGQREGRIVPFLVGTSSDRSGHQVQVHFAADLVWTSEKTLNVRLVLRAVTDENGTWRPVRELEVQSLGNGHIGDTAFVAEVSEAAKGMAARWGQVFVELTSAS